MSWNGALRSAILLLAIWWAWIDTIWVTNGLHPQHVTVRTMLILVMFGSLIMSSSIPEAFDGRALGFAGTFVAIQVRRSLFFVWTVPTIGRTLSDHSIDGKVLLGFTVASAGAVALWWM